MEDRFVNSDKGVHSLLYLYQAAAAPEARRGIVAFMSRKKQLLVIQVVQGDILEAGHVVKVKHIVVGVEVVSGLFLLDVVRVGLLAVGRERGAFVLALLALAAVEAFLFVLKLFDDDFVVVAVQRLHVQTEALKLLDEDLEGLRNARRRDVLALDDGLVGLHAAHDIVGLDRQNLLKRVGRAVSFQRPHFHLAEALTAVFAADYTICCVPWAVQAPLAALREHLDNVGGPMEQRGAIGVYASTGTLSAATTLAGQLNSGRITGALLPGSTTPPEQIAAAYAAVLASEEDPARPLNTLVLTGVTVPPVASRLGRTEQEVCLKNGVTPLEAGPGDVVQIVRAISTYTVNAEGTADVSLLDITTIRTLDYVRKAIRERISLRFPREKLSTRTPPKVRSEILDVLRGLENLEIVEEVDANADGVVVERDLQDANRLDAKIPTDVVNGLHVFAGRIDLLL